MAPPRIRVSSETTIANTLARRPMDANKGIMGSLLLGLAPGPGR